jgi:hypothetical protein
VTAQSPRVYAASSLSKAVGESFFEADGLSCAIFASRYKRKLELVALAVDEPGLARDARAAEARGYRAGREALTIEPVLLRRETRRDRWGKRLGLNVEPQTGDPGFDERVYLETATPEREVRRLFASPALRAAVLAALEVFPMLVVGAEAGLVVGARSTSSDAELDVFTQRARVPALARVLRALPPELSLASREVPGGSTLFVSLVGMGAVVLFAVGMVSLDRSRTISNALVVPALVGLGLVWSVAFLVLRGLVRGRPDGLRLFLLLALAGGPALASLLVGLASLANERLDRHAPTPYQVRVARFDPPRGKSKGTLVVAGLPREAGGRGDETSLPARLMAAPYCVRLELRVAPGWLGRPWIVDARCLDFERLR